MTRQLFRLSLKYNPVERSCCRRFVTKKKQMETKQLWKNEKRNEKPMSSKLRLGGGIDAGIHVQTTPDVVGRFSS